MNENCTIAGCYRSFKYLAWRCCRISLCRILVIVTATSILLGLWTASAQRQRAGVRAVVQCRGSITYAPRPWTYVSVPDFAVRLLGKDFFYSVDEVELRKEFDESAFAILGDFKSLHRINVTWPQSMSTDQLIHIGACRNLEKLSIRRFTKDTALEGDFRHLGRLTKLRLLSLANLPSQNRDVSFLRRLQKLEELSLALSQITDEEVAIIGELRNLRSLILTVNSISDAAMISIAHLDKLEGLSVSSCEITSTGAQELIALKSLRYLDLANTKIDDDAIGTLVGLTSLEKLNVLGTEVDPKIWTT